MKNAMLTILIQKDDESVWYAGQIDDLPRLLKNMEEKLTIGKK